MNTEGLVKDPVEDVTTIFEEPTFPAGVFAIILVGVCETMVARAPPIDTPEIFSKCDPRIVNVVPPVVGPISGLTEVKDVSVAVYSNPFIATTEK